ncbi:uncharacterized protein LOC126894991 [Daktulosphaira vitifoliae]|uniref:uncharacterized protein LOC126894991 n=1 Tax=Daktulosphaira vitifoliae TaxID=58002 RepID=UPI0021AAE3A2|nr:uncharacterized protein LOC126894991 [Daktulosphaira vitifoliae]
MRSLLPEGIGDAALKEFWLQKLPSAVLTVVAGLDGSLDELAERADRVMDVSSANRDVYALSTSSAPEPDRLRAIENSILALTAQVATLATIQTNNRPPDQHRRQRSSFRSRSRSRSRAYNHKWCIYHNRFGNEARKCRPPCAYSSEN